MWSGSRPFASAPLAAGSTMHHIQISRAFVQDSPHSDTCISEPIHHSAPLCSHSAPPKFCCCLNFLGTIFPLHCSYNVELCCINQVIRVYFISSTEFSRCKLLNCEWIYLSFCDVCIAAAGQCQNLVIVYWRYMYCYQPYYISFSPINFFTVLRYVYLFLLCYFDPSFDCKIALHINRPTFVFTNN